MRGLWFIALLAACAPVRVPVDVAERQCLADLRLAGGPRGGVSVTAGTGGVGVAVGVSGPLARRDPAEVFDACVVRRSGNPPSRPLDRQPGWQG